MKTLLKSFVCVGQILGLLLNGLLITSCSTHKLITYLGNIINVDNYDFCEQFSSINSYQIDYSFAMTQFTMKGCYQSIEKKAINLNTSQSIDKLLSNSKKVILNLGEYEILRLCEYDEFTFKYDKVEIEENLKSFAYYLNASLELISLYNENIIVTGFYNSQLINSNGFKYDHLINAYNEQVQNIINNFKIKFIIPDLKEYVTGSNKLSLDGAKAYFDEVL